MQTNKLSDEGVLIKKYKVRRTGMNQASLEISLPKEAFAREARRFNMSPEKAVKKLIGVWRYDSFPGLYLSFELKEMKKEDQQALLMIEDSRSSANHKLSRREPK